MAIRTALTDLLDIKHPILLAPMGGVAGGRLAAAVTNAGGFGILGGGYGREDFFEAELAAAGNARIGIGFITWALEERPHMLERALERNPAAILLSFGDEMQFAPAVKQAGAHLICQVQSVSQARRAVDAGADVIVAQGTEAGGHGATRATLPLVPAVVDAVGDIPVAAAGGIADGRGLAAALMLGASGVLLGSRFYATQESLATDAAIQRLNGQSGDQTIRGRTFDIVRRIEWPDGYTLRTLTNAFSDRWGNREAELRENQDQAVVEFEAAIDAHDYDTAAVLAGEAADLINDNPSAAEIVDRMVAEAETLMTSAPATFVVD